MLFKLAWRNIWRSRRRSLITMSSILFAVFFAVIMRSLQFGTYDRLIENVVSSYSGYIQVHRAGYWDDQILDNAMTVGNLPTTLREKVPGIVSVLPRIESFALAASEEKTRGVLVVALNPELENAMLGLSDKTTAGTLIASGETSIMLGDRLAERLNVIPGDTLILLGQGYRGMSAAGKYPVRGLISFPSPVLSSSVAFIPYSAGESLFSMEGLATSLVVQIESDLDARIINRDILSTVDTTAVESLTWREMMPELVQTIQADSAGGVIMILILYLVISFGIFGTLLMMMNERQFEFGVLLAIGMSRVVLISVLLVEMALLALGGIFAGAAVAYPLQLYFNRNPIQFTGAAADALETYGWEAVMVSSTDLSISVAHALTVLLITAVISLYAVFVLSRLQPVDAMHR
jgi:putative ABC transport system permease protein